MHSFKILLSGFLFSFLFIAQTNVSAEGRTGEQVYNASCATCHATGVANAPKINDMETWKARGKTPAQLFEGAKKGINAMPAKGLCMDCTDAELKAAIQFMTSKK